MRKTKFLGKVLSLALAITLIAGMVPEMHAKTAESVNTGWTEVTAENQEDVIKNLADLSQLDNATYINFISAAKEVHLKYFTLSDSTNGNYYYLLGKKGDSYIYLYKKYLNSYEAVEDSCTELDLNNATYYYYPQYDATFNLHEGQMSMNTSVKMIAGMLTSLPTPTRDGYIFTGWYDDPQSDKPESNKNEASPYNVYSSATEIHAHWCKKWPDGSKDWVRATTIKELESAELPFFTLQEAEKFADEYIVRYPYPTDTYEVIIGRIYNYSTVCYIVYDSKYKSVGYYPDPATLEENMSQHTYYVLRTPGTTSDDSENPSVTPTPAPAPVTPTPAPAPVTPTTAPSAGDTSSDSSDSGSSAPEPVLTTTNIAGEQITGWDAITKVISTQTKDKQQNVSGANQDLLHVDASGFDKTIPAATVKAVSTSALRGLHVFIGNSDAVTFLAKSKLSGYKETSFEHKDTVTEHSRTIDFTNKQALGTGVVFHTTVPVKNGEVTVYKVDANGRTRIVKTVSNAGGQVCFPITETATYVLEY